MSSPIISVKNIGKKYRLGFTLGHDTLRDQITHGARRIAHSVRRIAHGAKGIAGSGKLLNNPITQSLNNSITQSPNNSKEFWALKDISFDVQQGEVVGIIGANGAGKSTLLKILSEITEPTEGEIHIRGRVASLLEVGTGFHPELSGRENVYMNGAILGMTKAEIKSKFDEIVAFSGVEKFIDTPVKRYSSGMNVRLAFAVAAHLEPKILLVDEVLAVGDASFQKKCLGKMQDVSLEGRTVLFVSHNMGTIRGLTSRCLLLNEGKIRFDGATEACIDHYLADSLLSLNSDTIFSKITPTIERPVVINSVTLKGEKGLKTDTFHIGMPLKLELHLRTYKPPKKIQAAIRILNMDGISIYHLVCRDSGHDFFIANNNSTLTVELSKIMLYPGQYLIYATIMSAEATHTVYQKFEPAISFFVDQASGLEVARRLGKNKGLVHEKAFWKITD